MQLKNFRDTVKYVAPPVLVDVAKQVRGRLNNKTIEWEYMPQGWAAQLNNSDIKGWNVDSILQTYRAKWSDFVKSLKGTAPIAASLEASSPYEIDMGFHNTIMTYGYVFARACHMKSAISMLDWGGSIGHYYLFSKTLMPDVELDFHCKDMPVTADYGRKILPEAHFYADDSCLERQYDLVMSSASLLYSEDWKTTLQKLARASKGYLFIAQTPTVENVASFVVVQRAYKYNYNSEYLGWCFNRQELIDVAEAAGVKLEREFLYNYQPEIVNAPEQCHYRGYLFKAI